MAAAKICVLIFLVHLTLLTSFGSRDQSGLTVAQPFESDPIQLSSDDDGDDGTGQYARRVRKPYQPMRFGKRLSVVNKDRFSQLFKDFPKDN